MQVATLEIIDLTGIPAPLLLGEVGADRGFEWLDRAVEVSAR